MKYLLILLISLVACGNTCCQLEPFQDEDAIITPNFRLDMIRANKISKITLNYLSKPDGATISDDGTERRYFFDTAGKIIETICTIKTNTGSVDTVKCKYYYDSFGNLTIKRTEMGDFYDTWYYKWDKDHLLKTEAHIHETSSITAEGDFKIATQKVISADSFAYISYPKQLQQYAYNEDNKVFQKTITQYDENKRFLSRNSHYAVGWLYSQVDLKYDSKGRLTGYLNTGNLNGDMNQNTTIQYDSLGRIDEEGIWVDNKQKHHIEFMYDNATELISNKLDRDNDKAVIYIVKFSYEIYNNRGVSTATK